MHRSIYEAAFGPETAFDRLSEIKPKHMLRPYPNAESAGSKVKSADSCGTVRQPNLASLERIHLLFPPPSLLAVVLPSEPKQTQDQEGGEGTKGVRHDEIHRRAQPCAAIFPAPTGVRRRFWSAPRR